MTKKKKRIDSQQQSLFDLIQGMQETQDAPKPLGSFNIDSRFRELVTTIVRGHKESRYIIAARMSELTNTEITKGMLDSWTADSKQQNRFPAVYLPAFCEAVGSTEPLRLLGSLAGAFVLPGPEALRAEIQRIEEDIANKQGEKRKRMMFLREMEARP